MAGRRVGNGTARMRRMICRPPGRMDITYGVNTRTNHQGWDCNELEMLKHLARWAKGHPRAEEVEHLHSRREGVAGRSNRLRAEEVARSHSQPEGVARRSSSARPEGVKSLAIRREGVVVLLLIPSLRLEGVNL